MVCKSCQGGKTIFREGLCMPCYLAKLEKLAAKMHKKKGRAVFIARRKIGGKSWENIGD